MGRFWIHWTYHKDSYMAHRRDWKTGFEGRYRRTISPSSPNRNLLCPRDLSAAPSPEHRNSVTTAASTSTTITTTTTTATTTTTTLPTGPIRSFPTSHYIQANNSKNLCDDKTVINNGWPSNGQTSSTTVSFTSEELKAFKARRANANDTVSQSHPAQPHSPHSPQLHSSQSSPTLSALPPLTLEGSAVSSVSGGTDPQFGIGQSSSLASPSKLSSEQSWRASLDSLNQSISPSGSSTATSNKYSPRTITRTTSLADPLHAPEETGKLQDTPVLPRTSSINESLSRITAISDSLSRSTSVADSLCRSISVTETPTHNRSNSVSDTSSHLSSLPEVQPVSPASPVSSVPHDGPVTAHPATVTEEASSPVSSKSSIHSLSPKSPESLPSLVAQSPGSPSVSSHSTSTPPASTSVASTLLSCPVTSPSMSSPMVPVDHANILVLGYGRTPYQEEIDCDRLSQDYVPQFSMDTKLQALLAPGPEHKTAANYMQGVFNLELRRDFISSTHANHPDVIQPPRSQAPATTAKSHASNGLEAVCERVPLPADSAYFTTSESKAKMLTRLRSSSETLHDDLTDQQTLYKKKEELVASIGRKLEILRAEREAIKEEMRLNQELGVEVTSRVEARARLVEAEKYKLHVEEIGKITSLLLGLSGRLARAENALLHQLDSEEKNILERKRDKLSEQLEEAKRLKENIDRRAIQVSKVLNQYLTEDQYADYDHFIKMKAKLIMDAREIDDKIKLGEEQHQALQDAMCKKPS